MKTFVSAVLAGISVGLGGLVFLSVENRVVGAALFTIGLFAVCTFGFHLFTGKVCYVFQNDRGYALDLPVIWLGNLAGTGVTAVDLAMKDPADLVVRNVPAAKNPASTLPPNPKRTISSNK